MTKSTGYCLLLSCKEMTRIGPFSPALQAFSRQWENASTKTHLHHCPVVVEHSSGNPAAVGGRQNQARALGLSPRVTTRVVGISYQLNLLKCHSVSLIWEHLNSLYISQIKLWKSSRSWWVPVCHKHTHSTPQ